MEAGNGRHAPCGYLEEGVVARPHLTDHMRGATHMLVITSLNSKTATWRYRHNVYHAKMPLPRA
jgi:hypothetical protein